MTKEPRDPCQLQACSIQKCLQANKYKEEMCRAEFKVMELCCKKWSQSLCCSGFKPSTENEETEKKYN